MRFAPDGRNHYCRRDEVPRAFPPKKVKVFYQAVRTGSNGRNVPAWLQANFFKISAMWPMFPFANPNASPPGPASTPVDLPAMIPSKETFLFALKQIERLSPAPVILANALALLRDPQADLESIATLVGRDSALATDIIRCSNSAYFGGEPSGNVFEAVQKIGVRETMRLLNLAVARIVGQRDLASYGIHGTDYWAESLFNGLFLHVLARETGGNDPEEAYTVGLLRYIGRLAINQTIENLHGGLYWDGRESISKWERDNVGIAQAEAGALLMAKWKFPEATVRAIAAQDAPATLAEDSWLADALYFTAAMLPQGLGTPFLPAVGPTWTPTAITGEFMHRHDLTAEAVDALLRTTSQSFDEIRVNFGV